MSQPPRDDRPETGDWRTDAHAAGGTDPDPTVYIPQGQAGVAESASPMGPDREESPRWMMPVFSGIASLLVGLLLGWLIFSGNEGSGDDLQDQEALQTQVEELTGTNSELQTQVEDLTAQLAALEGGEGSDQGSGGAGEVDDLRDQVDTLESENLSLSEQVTSLEEQNSELQGRVEEILAEFDEAFVPVPDVVNQSADSVADLATENGWVLVQIPTATDSAEPGTVLSQTPAAGTPMLAGSALAIGVATAPEEQPDPDGHGGVIFEESGTGSQEMEVSLEGGIRHLLMWTFTGEGTHTVTVLDEDASPLLHLVEVNGPSQGATSLPLAGSYRLEVSTDSDMEWTLQIVRLP